MTKERFIQNFQLLLIELRDLTSQYCFNELSANYKFLLEPSGWAVSDHLTAFEKEYMADFWKLRGKAISIEDVVALLYRDGVTTKWADCHICYSDPDLTVVKIVCSRQFRDEIEVYYLEKGTGPFKALVRMPPYSANGKKFDVNWQSKANIETRNSIWTRLKQLFFLE